MKDFYGIDFIVGDIVAVVYHPMAYEFSLQKGTCKAMDDRSATVMLDNGESARYMLSADHTVHRIVKIPNKTAEEEGVVVDAVGQPITVGCKIAFQRPIELGNSCKGFSYAGIVSKVTAAYVFAKLEDGTESRKKFNGAVMME